MTRASVWIFVACFPSNRRFFRENHCTCISRILFCTVTLLVSSPQPQRWWKRKKEAKQNLWSCSTLLGRFLCHHCMTNTFTYIRSSLASLMAIVATLILSEILMQRLKYTVALKARSWRSILSLKETWQSVQN